MKTEVKDNKTANNNNHVNGINTVTADNKSKQFIHGNPVNGVSASKENEAEKPTPQAEPFKAEAPKTEAVKPALNLEAVLKLVTDLNRKKIQRDKLIETIEHLESFEVELKEDTDDTESNVYQGCVLTIEDDKHRKFITKNPVIIFTVAQQVNSLCVGKLSEIEAGIIIPA